MIQFLFFAYIGISSLIAFSNWRQGVYLAMIAGMLQDPIRKLMPGAPGYMVLAFVPIFLALSAGLFSRGNPWRGFIASNRKLAPRFTFFWISLALSFLVLLVNYGISALPIAVIGMIGYVFPIMAVIAGFWFVQSIEAFQRLVVFYCVATAILLIGGLLEHWKIFPQWAALGTAVLDMTWIRHVPGYIVKLTAGFYRSPDLMGWHAALLSMLSFMMLLYKKSPLARVFWIGLVVWGTVMLLISGRNKMIFMPLIFISTIGLAYLYKGNVAKSLTTVLASVVAVALFWAANSQMQIDEEYLMYVGVGSSTATERLTGHGILSVFETFRQSGFFGEGMGSASTGARFGGSVGIKTWQESGTSKLMVELGVVGFIAVILLGVGIMHSMFNLLKAMPSHAPNAFLFVALLGIMAANAASFIVSHQAFGDPFLVTLTGFLLGLTLSAPRWIGVHEKQKVKATRRPVLSE